MSNAVVDGCFRACKDGGICTNTETGVGNGSKMHMCSVVMNWAELLFLEINATTTKAASSSSQSCARMCLAEWVCKKSAKLAKSTARRSSGLNSSPGKYSSHELGMAESSAQGPSLDPLDSMTLTKQNQPSKL
jgi:hypothetical protein